MTATTPLSDAPGLPPSDPPLAAPPSGGALHGLDPFGLRTFKLLNRWFMVPITRAGYGAWLGSPLSGYILLLRVRGRKSGLVRETPLSYLVADGSVWVLAGFGPKTEWYRNLLAEPAVEVQLPGRVVKGTATEVTTPAVRARVVPSLVRATGLAAFLSGVNPWRVGDEAILAAVDFVPLIRIDAEDGWLDPGPDDPGGRAWIWRQALALGATVAALAVLRRLLR
jgi:deazaflavin-dependent oxidoreductase (nitroreductase family)